MSITTKTSAEAALKKAQAIRRALMQKPTLRSGPAAAAAQRRFVVASRNRVAPMGKERKQVDIPLTATQMLIAPTGVIVNPVQVGAGIFNRVGQRIKGRSLRITYWITNSATTLQSAGRIIAVYDKAPAAAVPAFATVFQTTDQAGAAAAATPVSQLSIAFRDRMVVLCNRIIYLPSITNTAGVLTNNGLLATDGGPLVGDIFIPLKSLMTGYNATANPIVVANFSYGAIYLYWHCTNDTGWVANWASRYVYEDHQ